MKVLVISVHPDDETLGAGGTILKHKANNDEIFWLNLTSISIEINYSPEQIENRNSLLKKVSEAYNFDKFYDLKLITTKLDTYERAVIIKKISSVFEEIKPEILYIPFMNDVHTDHKVSFDVISSCMKSFRYPYIKKVLMMEVPCYTDFSPNLQGQWFVPNYFVNITDFLDKKLSILELYKSELGESPFPSSLENIKSLAVNRSCISNFKYAEAFMLLKERVD